MYLTLRQRLEQIDALLRDSGVERDFVRCALAAWIAATSREVTALEQFKFQQRSRRALRCTILRTLLQEDYRGFSCNWLATRSISGFVRSSAGRRVALRGEPAGRHPRLRNLPHGFLGRPMRVQGFAHRELALAWGVLTHNLWLLARMSKTKKEAVPLHAAA